MSFHDRWLAKQMEDPEFRAEFERVSRLFDPGPAGPEFDTMIPYAFAECGVCRLAGPDQDGNYDLLERDECPVHGAAPAQVEPRRAA